MLIIEGTLLPLVVVGAVRKPKTNEVVMTVDEDQLWSSGGLLVALVVPGSDAHATLNQHELLAWLKCHRRQVWRSAARLALVIEDDTVRSCAEEWLDIAAPQLCQGEVHAFHALKPALDWLSRPCAEFEEAAAAVSVARKRG